MLLENVPPKKMVRCLGTNVIAEVVKHTEGSSTVIIDGHRTTWAKLTPVVIYVPPEPENKDHSETTTTEKNCPLEASASFKRKEEPGGKDIFGVRRGTKASEVNDYLLEKKKEITMKNILDNLTAANKGNIRSHLRRLTKDGYLLFDEKKETWTLSDKVRELLDKG